MICSKCKIEKDISCFYKPLNRPIYTVCKDCRNAWMREWRKNNKKKVKEQNQKWYNENGGKEKKKEYDKNRLDYTRVRDREKYKNDKSFRNKKILRTRLLSTTNGKKKYKKTLELLDIDYKVYLKWLEFQFDDKMSWENQGKYWSIDHIIPCNFFDLDENENQIKCFNWSNLKPMENSLNFSKNDKIDKELINKHFYNTVPSFLELYNLNKDFEKFIKKRDSLMLELP